MEPDAWLTLAVLVVLVGILVREVVTPAAAMLGALVTLVLIGVAEPDVALAGFSSTATATVAGLFVVADALRRHAGVERVLHAGLVGARSERGVLLRLCAPVGTASAVIANTPLVASLAPVVRSWADRTGRSPSRVLMPLSFATILGGLATTIGTSTTLVASGVVQRVTGEPFSVFEVTPLGLPVAIVGILVLVALAPVLLPERGVVRTPREREYSFRMVVEEDGPLDGRTIEDAGLRHLDELFVVAIDRGPAGIVASRPDRRLSGGDVLVINGSVEHVRSLPSVGLRHADAAQVQALGEQTHLHEVVVGRLSPLVGRTLKDLSFRGRYGAAVLAIDRDGEEVRGKLGTEALQAGDVLLVSAAPEFAERWRDAPEFATVASLEDELSSGTDRSWLVVGVTLGIVLVAGLGVASLVEAVLLACVVLGVTRTIDLRDAIASLDVDVLLIIAAAIGIGGVVEESGLAGVIADRIGDVATATSATVALLLLLVATAVLTEVVTNVASAALMVPIAMSTATIAGVDPRGWAVAVAIGASASFLTPIGYQTNTIVYGLGGYRFTDFWRLGLPIVVTTLATALAVVPLVWG